MSIDTKIKTANRGGIRRLQRSAADDPAVTEQRRAQPANRLPEPPPMAGRRNPRWIALGVVALCLGGLLSYMIYAQVAAQSAVVAMTRTVHRGAVIQATDLTTTSVGGTTKVSTVPADQLQSLVGKRAGYDLVEGSLVPALAVDEPPLPETGRAVVGLKLNQGRAPVGLLPASAEVRLVPVPTDDRQAAAQPAPSAAPPPNYNGKVVDVTEGADGTSILLNVEVAAGDAPAIAQLAAQDRIVVLRDADK